ncbi:hypothetical protein PHMEG_00018700 [Phytophthora megakarya]|uniref:Ty3 transposon capsid-like protein domain-containing protein n=1 Tax=Phytophthora megakarya TaxID=4795 RepID=A0A225VW00_9STRA|nr:hypothetical protein PHMEG_00018700 [Phytophthora megakarya]
MAVELQELREEVRQLRLRREDNPPRGQQRVERDSGRGPREPRGRYQQALRSDDDEREYDVGHGRSPDRERRGTSQGRHEAPSRRRVEHQRRGRPGGNGHPSSSSSSDDSDDRGHRGHGPSRGRRRSSESSSSGSDEWEPARRRHPPREHREPRRGRRHRERRDSLSRQGGHRDRHQEPVRRANVKDLELPTFTPTSGTSVSTWTDRIDLALQGARESGRGEWSDHALYFILGNKLMAEAASWWVDFNRRLNDPERTWTHLKQALLRRYGPKEDISLAEYRVNTRSRGMKESHADYAAALRKAAGGSRVSERVLMAQFYRGLDKTTRQLVKQQEPEHLEEAVIKATEIDDPMESLAPMAATVEQASGTTVVAATNSTGDAPARTVTLHGVGSVYVPVSRVTEGIKNYAAVDPDGLVLYTNLKGAWNIITGKYDLPAGRTWRTPGTRRNQVKSGRSRRKQRLKEPT